MPTTPPPVIVTTDLSSDDHAIPTSAGSPVGTTHSTPPRQSASLLSPSGNGNGNGVPPSPTLTNNSSVHFDQTPSSPSPAQQSTLALRENNPTADSGRDTLQVIGENDPVRHKRMWSIGTSSSGDGDAEKGLSNVKSTGEQTLVDKEIDEKEGKGKKSKKQKRGEFQSSRLDPDNDNTDPTPFKEKPSRLAMMVDPKSLEELEKMGGTAGLLAGLGIDPKRGLTTTAAGAPRGSGDMGGSGPQWSADVEKRREIYGRNELPQRKGKSLLRLMWMAFQDKILVCLHFY
jgi:Ca2+-transporting ATPase